jgi:sensor domain CHASE-containing protein
MATSQAANLVEKRMSHEQKPITDDVPNYSSHGESSQTMKALTWQGKTNVKVGQ